METPQTQRIKLRGHHISTFAEDLHEKSELERRLAEIEQEKYYDDPVMQKEAVECVKRIAKQDWEHYLNRDMICEYGIKMVNSVNAIYDLLRTHPETEVEIVDGLDSICMADCPQKDSSCKESVPDDEDAYALNFYGLEVGKIYTAAEIQEKIKKLEGWSGVRSTRDKKGIISLGDRLIQRMQDYSRKKERDLNESVSILVDAGKVCSLLSIGNNSYQKPKQPNFLVRLFKKVFG